MAGIVFELNTLQALSVCFILAVGYVASLYIWNNKLHRDHPATIKRRCISVLLFSSLAPGFVWYFSTPTETLGHSLMTWLGVRFSGTIMAAVLPLFLTIVLFLGPLTLFYLDGVLKLYLEPKYWQANMKNLIWLRNHVVAPFSEEFIFRACMIPLLIPSVGAGTAVFLAPLFFGVAHFHHMVERVRNKHADLKTAFLQSLFQFSYTTVFGAYSAFLFIRTGSLVAPVVAHAFCNHMGFPDIGMVFQYPPPQRYKIMANFVIGLVLWCFLLYPLTHPPLFSNTAYNLLL